MNVELGAFRGALRELMHEGRVVMGAGGTIVLPSFQSRNEFTGTYRHNRRGFGFVVPTDPAAHEDLYVPEGQNGGAITGDLVRAVITMPLVMPPVVVPMKQTRSAALTTLFALSRE